MQQQLPNNLFQVALKNVKLLHWYTVPILRCKPSRIAQRCMQLTVMKCKLMLVVYSNV